MPGRREFSRKRLVQAACGPDMAFLQRGCELDMHFLQGGCGRIWPSCRSAWTVKPTAETSRQFGKFSILPRGFEPQRECRP